jgi:hypothetical protein
MLCCHRSSRCERSNDLTLWFGRVVSDCEDQGISKDKKKRGIPDAVILHVRMET